MIIQFYGECEGSYVNITLGNIEEDNFSLDPDAVMETTLEIIRGIFKPLGLNTRKARLVSRREYEENVEEDE